MPFPEQGRVTYQRTSLREVICQFRFTPVLQIDEGTPAVFQEKVRKQGFPGYERRGVTSFPVAVGYPAAPAPLFSQRLEHVFLSGDRISSIVLARDFVAVTTTAYPGWDRFGPWLGLAATAVRDIYQPTHVTRVGLRAQNVIRRRELGIEHLPWKDLLAHELLGLFADRDDADAMSQEITFNLVDENLRGRLAHGVVDAEDGKAYLIDIDYYSEHQQSFDDALVIAEPLHRHAWNTFRWCVLQPLHEAMRPVERHT
jgi:uncharacterized protein (TIGR04255 family)